MFVCFWFCFFWLVVVFIYLFILLFSSSSEEEKLHIGNEEVWPSSQAILSIVKL